MKKIIILFTAVAAVLFSSCAKVELDVWGTISGVVKDNDSSLPLDGVKVAITSTGASQVTNSDGKYSFTNLEAKDYTVSFEKAGYITHTEKVKVPSGGTVTADVLLVKNNLGISVTPNSLDFGLDKSSMNVTVTATGSQSVHFDVSASDDWITVSKSSGSVSQSADEIIRVMVDRNRAAGNYEGLLTFSTNSESLTVRIYMQVAGSGAPVVSIQSIDGKTQTQANVNCLITLEGGVSVSDYGICYATTANPTTNNSKISRGATSASQNFTCTLTGLTPGTEYHVRPYAISDNQTYYGDEKTFTTDGGNDEDYSSARIVSDNREVEIQLQHCYRNGTRVKIEATILNKSIQPYDTYAMYMNNQGYTLGSNTYTSHVEDDQFTSYRDDAVTKTLNNKSSQYELRTQLPVGSTKKLSIVVDGVPTNATKLSVYIATRFYNTTPDEYAYLTFENMPIY